MSDAHPTAESIFYEALDIDPGKRVAFIARACADNDVLLREVDSLLAAHSDADAFLGTPLLSPHDDATENTLQFGAYRTIRPLGSGGMGAVYLAERADDQFHKHVAIKLLKRGMDTDDILRRFRNERQVLASLEHPHIARLIDGGATEDGLPYLVMEFVDGLPIDTYCRTHRVGLPERLRLFQQVCDAVHYAHQNLIVHRDLKPGNILVTTDGTPKLLDFGIAKVLEHDPASYYSQAQTQADTQLLTPAYASPEQVRGQTVTTATDVYSLGVILYELLTEQPPYDLASASGPELERRISETQPPRPSTVGPKAPLDGRTREFMRALKGDLDNIVLMALRKEPERRYASAERFAEDIDRHLGGHPVAARPDTLGYRSAKFVRRHRLAVSTAALGIISLAVGLVTSTSLYVEARTARHTAERVNGFLQDMLASVDPNLAKGRDVSMLRIVLDNAARELDEELADEPTVAAELHDTIGTTYHSLSLYDEAERHLTRAIELQAQLHGTATVPYARAESQLAGVINDAGRPVEAEALLRRALIIFERDLGPAALPTLSTLNDLGLSLKFQGKYDDAEQAYRTVLERDQRPIEQALQLRMSCRNNLAALLQERGDLQAALAMFEMVLKIRREHLPPVHNDIALSLQNLSKACGTLGQTDRAIALYEESLAIRRQIYGPHHSMLGLALHNVGTALYNAGRLREAEERFREALGIYRRSLPDVHPHTASVLNNLGTLLATRGKFDEAIAFHEQALSMRRLLFGERDHRVATCLNNLASAFVEMERFDDALPLFEEALNIRREAFPEDHWLCALTEHRMAVLYLRKGQPQLAIVLQEKAMASWAAHFPDTHLRRIRAERQMAEIQLALGQTADAMGRLQAALDVCERAPAAQFVEAVILRSMLGESLSLLGRHEEAEPLLNDAFEYLRAQSASPGHTIRAHRRVLDLYDRWDMPKSRDAFLAAHPVSSLPDSGHGND
jgi:serine/threonine-protein kinase